jgi:hypothetical protein
MNTDHPPRARPNLKPTNEPQERSVAKEVLAACYPLAMFSMAIGDHLTTLPALRALAESFEGRLALICNKGARETFFSDVPLRATYEIQDKTISFGESDSTLPVSIRFDVDSLAKQIEECDLFISLNGWHSPSIDDLIGRLCVADSIGFFSSFQIRLPYSHDIHVIDTKFQIPQYLKPSLRLDAYSAAPAVSPDIRQWAQAWRARLPSEAKVLAVHAETRPARMWPIERFVRTLDKFLGNHTEVIILALGTKDLGLGKIDFNQRIVPCYNLPLPCAMSLVGVADLFMGVDSSLLHVADLFRVPGLGLFGPSSYAEAGFRFAPHRHVRGQDQTMAAISETEVLDALESLFEEFTSR